jgi:hypothetical protein
MRTTFLLLGLAGLALGGCAHRKATEGAFAPVDGIPNQPASGAVSSGRLIVSPGPSLLGRVTTLNEAGRFVVLNFPIGHLPRAEQRMFVYRRGLKVGEVSITTLRQDDYIVADIVEGEAAPGDEVRPGN